ncbi:MAG: helix-turn-helix domain-containing protein [Actinomycetota bacterium]|nr:helix-turn-helix domain-containing protein [Actinomycetota bacterium]
MATIGARRMLTYTEAAQALGVSTSTISRMVTGGALPAVRSGPRSVRIAPSELRKFMRKGGIPTDGTARKHG